ncbi:MAG TPA: hypothetical protein VE594_06830 [Nitrososphaeraceae archaeon]|nr:hypothetical protein [Nitrososphaeraceae archaeon]
MDNIGDKLYSIIDEIGKEKIQTDITLNVGVSVQYIGMIMDRCKKIIDFTNEENVGSLCEALLHFMLTTRTLPSARKVRISKVDLDVVIPNLHTLRNFPEKAIIIQIVKNSQGITEDVQNNISTIQPNANNIWTVSKEPVSGDYVNYTTESGNNMIKSFQRRNFQDIIVDIEAFLQKTDDRSFRFFH